MGRKEMVEKIFQEVGQSYNNLFCFACMTDDEVEEAYYKILKIE